LETYLSTSLYLPHHFRLQASPSDPANNHLLQDVRDRMVGYERLLWDYPQTTPNACHEGQPAPQLEGTPTLRAEVVNEIWGTLCQMLRGVGVGRSSAVQMP
jgi:hypothetical protein